MEPAGGRSEPACPVDRLKTRLQQQMMGRKLKALNCREKDMCQSDPLAIIHWGRRGRIRTRGKKVKISRDPQGGHWGREKDCSGERAVKEKEKGSGRKQPKVWR